MSAMTPPRLDTTPLRTTRAAPAPSDGTWRRALVTALTIAGAVAAAPAVAHAACTPTPVHIDVTTTSATVTWLETCPGPGSMQLLENGTAPNFQNGTLLGIEANLTSFKNGGAVTTNKMTLAPGHSYGNVRLCAVYTTSPTPTIACTGAFAIATSGSPPTPPVTLAITSPTSDATSVSFSWTMPSQFTSYHVRLNNADEQTVTRPPPFSYTSLDSSTDYTVSVEGCVYQGISGNHCLNNWVSAVIRTQAAPPKVPVTSKVFHMKPFGAGDCTLANGVVTFRSDGSFTFNAQVRTKHTTTSDYWHIALNLLDGSGRTIDSVPEFTGPAMKDAHPVPYDWTHNGGYAAGAYPALASVRMPGRC